MLDEAIQGDWTARRTSLTPLTKFTWSGALTGADDWEAAATRHFETVFCHADFTQNRETAESMWEDAASRRTGVCREVTVEELREIASAWKAGLTSGPDGVTYEAVRELLAREPWGTWLSAQFTRVLAAGRLPPTWAESLTVLLPRLPQPGGWKDTRPITLSSVMLKILAQILQHRLGTGLRQPSRIQYAIRGSSRQK